MVENLKDAYGISSNRYDSEEINNNFQDLNPPLERHEAIVAADRCYFCYDAPCMKACPTEIDIPLFIRQISTGTPKAAAITILNQNILGGMCARVCPTETLCEEACVREAAEGAPIKIGLLQRYATDYLMATKAHPFARKKATGKKIAVLGAGPAGLSCAHRLAMYGHGIVIFDARPKAGGLNEYGIAAYKSTDNFAQREVEWLLQIGGIEIKNDMKLGKNIILEQLKNDFDAVFIGTGLADNNELALDDARFVEVLHATNFITKIREASDLSNVPIGRDVVVIGGGMTAIDAAIQAKLLGALNVTLVYRRSKSQMNASVYEQDLAARKGVHIISNARPVAFIGAEKIKEIEFEYTDQNHEATGQKFRLAADQVFKAIGQKLDMSGFSKADTPRIEHGKIVINENGQTSIQGIWAGGDCTSAGVDLTVTAVAQGRDAAENIHKVLSA